MDNAVELADIIAQLRTDLSRAMREGEGSDLRFHAEQIELELTVGVERSREPGVRVKFWVFDAGASARQATTATQRLTLTLQPVRPDEDRPVFISGGELHGED
ncbi:trypco2 family protein [Streptomyces sp. NPDC059875]|uniref:trypco2 family protein n=1 Tax=unclassified Streptomyces TaxID=2593676 RepID=UPI00364A4645